MTACDSHLHILDPNFPSLTGKIPLGMTLDDYLAVREKFGTERAVIVQAKNYGTDNTCLTHALERLGTSGRGVAVVDRNVTEAELEQLHAAGVRGVRFSLWNLNSAVVTLNDLPMVAERIAPYGWHLQIHMHANQLVEAASLLRQQPCDLVIDHMGRIPSGIAPTSHPAFKLITELGREGRAWVKLSGPYLNPGSSSSDDAPRRLAAAWIEAMPERLVWGSDWPHITEQPNPPTIDYIAETLSHWSEGDTALINRIGNVTPNKLYGFSHAA